MNRIDSRARRSGRGDDRRIDVVNAANGIQVQTPLGVSVGEHLTFHFTFGLDPLPAYELRSVSIRP